MLWCSTRFEHDYLLHRNHSDQIVPFRVLQKLNHLTDLIQALSTFRLTKGDDHCHARLREVNGKSRRPCIKFGGR
ncbi:Uncharacterised protein [Vibrio cholerae]|nr:Uncharacterised protein [Vibrio cholerae]